MRRWGRGAARVPAGLALIAIVAVMLPSAALAQNGGAGTVRVSGVAGGNVRAVRFGNTADGFCTGWIASSPSYELELDEDGELTIRVEAPSDTTLVILGPDGTRCNDDDGDDQNPRISGEFVAGTYRIYVGSYDEGQAIRYTLLIEPGG